MRWADPRRAAALALLAALTAQAEEKSTYGKVDTFEPGKKYTCLPTADRKAWDCKQIGKAGETPEPESAPAASSRSEAPPSPPPSVSAPPPDVSAPLPAPSRRTAGELPSYLNVRAGGSPSPAPAPSAPPPPPPSAPVAEPPTAAPAPVAANAPSSAPTPVPVATPAGREPAPPASAPPAREAAATAPVRETPATEPPVAEHVAPPQAPAPSRAEAAAEAPSQPVTVPEPARAPAPAPSTGGTNSSAFLALGGEQYVIELARGANEGDLAAAPQPPRGEVYKLHLRQNGADLWLLVWGPFADVSAARAARADITQGTPGWPRRVAPLQAEVRHAGD